MTQKQAPLLLLPITTRGRLYTSVREPSNQNELMNVLMRDKNTNDNELPL